MLTYNNQFEVELKKLLIAEIDRLSENLCSGMAINDISHYKHEVGRITSLRAVIDMCDEVNSILSKR